MAKLGHVGGRKLHSTGGCSYSFVYSWWWVWLTPETCTTNCRIINRLLCVASRWTIIDIEYSFVWWFFSLVDRWEYKPMSIKTAVTTNVYLTVRLTDFLGALPHYYRFLRLYPVVSQNNACSLTSILHSNLKDAKHKLRSTSLLLYLFRSIILYFLKRREETRTQRS